MVSQNFDEVGLEAIIRGVGTYAANAGKLVTSNKAINASLNAAAKAATAFQKAIVNASKIVALAVVAMGALALKMAADFETAFAEVTTLFKASEEQIQRLRKEALGLAKDMGIDPVEAVQALYQAISAGIKPTEAIQFLRENVKLAVGGVTDLRTAVDLTTTILNAFGLGIEDLTRVSDALFTTVRLGKTTIDELGAAVFQIAPIASAAGVSIEEVGAAMAVLTASGTPTSVAAVQLRTAMIQLIAPTKETKKRMEELGFEFDENKLATEGLQSTFKELIEVTGGSKEKLRLLLGSVEAVNAVLVLGGEGAEAFSSGLTEMENKAGATEIAFEKMNKTFGRQFDLLKSKLKVLLIDIGTSVLPKLNKTVQALSDSLPKVRQLFEEWKPALVEAAKAVNDIRKAVVAFGSWIISHKIALVGAILAIGVAFAWASPVFGIAAGISGIILVIGLLRADIDELGESALKLEKTFLEVGRSITENFTLPLLKALNMTLDIITFGLKPLGVGLFDIGDIADVARESLNGYNEALRRIDDRLADLRQERAFEDALRLINTAVRDGTTDLIDFDLLLRTAARSMNVLQVQTLAWKMALARPIGAPFGPGAAGMPGGIVPPELPPLEPVVPPSLDGDGTAGAAEDVGNRIIAAWVKGIVDGIREGTVTVVDAMNLLRKGMVNAAGFIVDALLAESQRIATRMEVIVDTVERGFLTFQDLARLLAVGAFGAARGLADQFPIIDEEVWERAIERWLDTIAEGVREGTITVVDAIEFLERGMVNAARSIVDALVEEQFRVATQFEVMADIIARGFATVADAQRLIDIGAMEEALLILQTIAGEETEILDLIAEANRERFRLAFPEQFPEQPIRERLRILFPDLFPEQSFKEGGFVPAGQTTRAVLHGPEIVVPLASGTKVATQMALKTLSLGQIKLPSISMQEGGFIPSGTVAQAMLHGPELVVPLGGNTMALRALTQALQGISMGGRGNEGFRNFGNVNVFADGDADDLAMRNITRALGV